MWLLREKLSDFGVKQILHRVDTIPLYVHPKNSLRSQSWLLITVDKTWKTNQAEFCAFVKFTLQILANKSGCVQTNLFVFFFCTPHLRRKSTMRRCFYHTDLVQNAVFHNFSRQIAFIQYSGPSKHAWTFN